MDPEQSTEKQSPEESPSPLKQIRTFQGDVAEALNKQKESLVSIQRSEQVLREAHRVFSPPKSAEAVAEERSTRGLLLLIVGSLVLIVLGGLVGWYTYQSYTEKTALPAVEKTPNRFIASASLVPLDVQNMDRETFISSVQAERTKEVKEGAIVQLQLQKQLATTTSLISTRDLLNILESRASGSLIRSFSPVFMFGLFGAKSAGDEGSGATRTFIIIKLDSFENAFPGMLDWEKNIRDDLLLLFASPTEVSNIDSEAVFEDVVVQNKDARVLRDLDGRTVLLYAFFDNKMLIMTNNEAGLRTLVDKLNAEKLSR